MQSSHRFGATLVLLMALLQTGWAQQYASSAERTLFAAVNRERRAQGLPALHWDEALATAARLHAQRMAKEGSISHQLPGEPSLPSRVTKAGARFTSLAENVDAAGTATLVHRNFTNSPPHRANILDRDMDSAGIGVAERGGQLFVVEDFSRAK